MKNAWQSAKPLVGYTLGAFIAQVLIVAGPGIDSDLVALFTNLWIVGPVFLVGLAAASALAGVELSFLWGILVGMFWAPLILDIILPTVMLVGWVFFRFAEAIASPGKFLLVATFIAVAVAWVRAERDSGS